MHNVKSVAAPRDEKSNSIARSGLASRYQIPEGQMDRAAGAMKFGWVPVKSCRPSLLSGAMGIAGSAPATLVLPASSGLAYYRTEEETIADVV